jgi:outer membrane autotransporter protein
LNVFNSAAALTSPAEATKAGAQLSPTAVTSGVVQASAAATQTVSTVALSHLDRLRTEQADGNSGVATGEHNDDVGVWGQVFGGHANQSERDNVSGYSANYYGLLLGADAAVTDQVHAGGLFSYAKTSMSNTGDNTGTSASVNSYGLSAYGSYTGEPWYVNVLTGVAKQRYSTTRDVSYTGFSGVANGNFNGQQYTTAVQAGYPLNVGRWLPGVTVTPLMGLSYSTLRQDGYNETGGNGAGLSVGAANTTSLKSELAVKAETSFDTAYGKLQPLVQVGWHHEYHDSRLQSTASFADDTTGTSSFSTQSAKPISDTGALALGVTLVERKNLKVSARYTVEAGSGYTGQTGDVQVRWQY